MTEITTIGLDIAKQFFHVHYAYRDARPVIRRKLRRNQMQNLYAGLPSWLFAVQTSQITVEG